MIYLFYMCYVYIRQIYVSCLSFSCWPLPSLHYSALWITDSCCCFPGSVDTACIGRTLGAARRVGLSPHPAHVGFRRHPGSGCISSIFPAASYEVPGPTGGLSCWALGKPPLPHALQFWESGRGWFTALLIPGLPHYGLFGFSAISTP